MNIQLQAPQEHIRWKTAFLILSLIVIITLPLLSRQYGQSADEWVQITYGNDIWNYFTKGDQQALNYANKSLQFSNQEYYGGMFDFSMEALHHAFPSIPILYLRHFFNALLGVIMMLATALLARRLSGRWSVGCLALLFIFFSPRLFGESMNNPKDIPFACGFVVGIYGLISLLYQFPVRRWRNTIILGLGWGLAFGVRPAGGLLLTAYAGFFTVLFVLLHKPFKKYLSENKYKYGKQLVLCLGIALIGGYLIGLSTWPFGQQSPVSNLFQSLQGMANRDVYIRTLFEGHYKPGNHMPWYYELKWILISNPLAVIAGVLLFLVLVRQAIKSYGFFAVILLIFAAGFPLFYIVYKKSTVFDTWRHMFFVYPYWVVLASLGWDLTARVIKNQKYKWLPAAIALAGLLPAIIWIVRSHPNQYVYFNELAGGIKGAYGKYDLDYYQNTSLQAANWIREHVKPIPGRKIMVRSNMSGYDHYFAKDTGWIASDYGRYNERHAKDWDYYIHNGRFVAVEQIENGMWPPQNVIHRIEIDGVPICIIIQRKSNEGIAANKAYEQKDYVTAANLYGNYVKADSTDEYAWVNYGIALASIGQPDPAIIAFRHATRIDPSNPQFFDILAQVYEAKGDKANAQQAHNQAMSIASEQEEEAEQ